MKKVRLITLLFMTLILLSGLNQVFAREVPRQGEVPVKDNEKEEQQKVGKQKDGTEEPLHSLALDKIVVSTTRGATTAFEAPASVLLIDSEELKRTQSSTLKDALKNVPNVNFTDGNMGVIQKPSIRGLDQDQIIIKVDGARQNYRSAGGIGRNPVPFDPELLEEVEVLRGPASVTHGGGGIGGVISLTTKDAADFLKPGQRFGALVKGGGQSADRQYFSTVSLYGQYNDLDILVSGTYRDFDDMETSDSEASDSFERDGNSRSGLFKISMIPNDQHRASITINTYEDDFSFNSSVPAEASEYETEQNRVSGNWFWNKGDGMVDLVATAQYTQRTNRMENDYRDIEDDFNSMGLDVYNTFNGQIFDFLDADLTIGGDFYFDHQEGTDYGKPDASRPDADSRDYGSFARLKLTILDQLELIPSARYSAFTREAQNSIFDAPELSDNRISPQMTVKWSPVKWFDIFGSFAETYRPPTMDEIYLEMFYPMPPGRPDIRVLPNPDLKPETAKTWEAGVGLGFDSLFSTNDPLRFKFVAFTEQVKDFITPTKTPVMTATSMDYTSINVGKVNRDGVEVEMDYRYHSYSFKASYGKVNGKNADTNEPEGEVPGTFALGLGWDLADNISLYLNSRFVEKSQNAWGDKVDAYNVHDFGLVCTPRNNIRIDLGVDNLFDEEYKNYYGDVDKSRNVKLCLSVSF